MSAATITDITAAAAKKGKSKSDNVSLSVILTEELYDKIMLDSILSKTPITQMIEDWVDQDVSPQSFTIELSSLMNNVIPREKFEPGVALKTLSVAVSPKHYALIRMEALRRNTTIRAILKTWIEDNTREWNFEEVGSQRWEELKVA